MFKFIAHAYHLNATVVFEVDEDSTQYLQFKVYKHLYTEGATIFYEHATLQNKHTKLLSEAEILLSGSIKWDGCVHWNLGSDTGYLHTCEPHEISDFAGIILYAYNLGVSILNKEADPLPSEIIFRQ